MSETEVEKEKKKISLLAKIIDGSRKRDPFEKRHWYENEYRLWPSTDSHLCQRAPFNLSTRRNGVPPPPGGFGGWRCRKRGGEERRRRKRERGKKKERKKRRREKKKGIHAESGASSTWNALHDHRVRKAQINYIMARLKRMLFNHRPEPP